MKGLVFIGVLASVLASALSARILAVVPLASKSHFFFCQGVLSALAARGHHVTMYIPYEPPQPVPNMKHVIIHTLQEERMEESMDFETLMKWSKGNPYFGMRGEVVWNLMYTFCEEFLEHQKFKELLSSKEKFDLVMVEASFGSESLVVLGHFFSAPVINLHTFHSWSVWNRIHGNPLQMAYAPDVVSFPFSDKMSFTERFRNAVSIFGTLAMYYFSHLPKHQSLIDRVFHDPSIPPLEEMLTNVSLTLANIHPTVGYPLSYTSNIVPIAGIHLAGQLPPLPKDIKVFMDSGKNAVIFFSLGSLVPTHLMPPEYIKLFTNVFRKLPYKILWKIELDTVPDLPKNVMISKWLPQQSVLAHPNCVLFITHGGLMSQYEAFNAGVPVVGIPFFGDQPFNVKMYETLGVGAELDFHTLTEESMYKVITSVVGKPDYRKNAKRVSTLFQHRVMSPADTAVYWTEYVLRHGGAHHLRPTSAHMPLYQLYLLDILGVVVLALVTLLLLLRLILSLLCRLCCGYSQKETVYSKKKKNQ